MPKSVQNYLSTEMASWQILGVDGHFEGKNPWRDYHTLFAEPLAELVGGLPTEVVAMNALTVNLHLMLTSFYAPTPKKYKIICEAGAFPSDQYALETHIKMRGYDPQTTLIEIAPRHGEHTLRTDDIINTINQHAHETALVFMAGVNYYTGQLYDLQAIAQAAHHHHLTVGYDLAHAIGNVPLHLHDWHVDFAVWCSYKYLNSGPGGVAGAFVHQKHADKPELPRLAGWWGHNDQTRFLMQKGFEPMHGAQGWQLSNAPVLSMAAHKAALDIYEQVGMNALRKKSELMSEYLFYLIQLLQIQYPQANIQIITPNDPAARGCQVSIIIPNKGKQVYNALLKNQIIVDWREPDVIRLAPVPIYNRFDEIARFYNVMKDILINLFGG
jgi:kynureninase